MNELTKFDALEMFADSLERDLDPITQSEQWLSGYVAGLRRAISMMKKTVPATNDTQSSAKDMDNSISHQNCNTSEEKCQEDSNKIGKAIRKARAKQGMTATELAKKMGVSKSAVSEWENGKSHPSWKNLHKVCEILRIPESNLF